MNWVPSLGQRVEHSDRGPGQIERHYAGGQVLVRFDRFPDLPWLLPSTELTVATPEHPRSTETFADARPREDAFQALEALRLGVVPRNLARHYTVARDAALAGLDQLAGARGGLRLIWGDYGAGKTHILEIGERIALDAGFATARIILNPHHLAPHHPKRLWSAIVSSVRFPDEQIQGITPLLNRLSKSADHFRSDGPRMSRFLSPLLHAWKSADQEAIGWIHDWLCGDNIDGSTVSSVARKIGWRGPYLLALSDFRTYARMYIHMISTLATWISDAGWKGLLVFFDEVERVDMLHKEQLGYAVDVLKYLAAAIVETNELAFDPETLSRGGQEVHREIPLRFAADNSLGAVFAFTPLEEIQALVGTVLADPKHQALVLTRLNMDDGMELIERLGTIYQRAHPDFDFGTSHLGTVKAELIKDENSVAETRQLVRRIIHRFDHLRLMGR